MKKFDFKKEYKDLYLPKSKPEIIYVPKMKFFAIEGQGNPNDENGEYQIAVGTLYALSYTVKMSKMGKDIPEGYFDYVVPPLEGFWWSEDDVFDSVAKENFCWLSVIRQPEFVTEDVFIWAKEQVMKKKPELSVSNVNYLEFNEGTCVQMMHKGAYDDEPETIEKMESYMKTMGYINDIGSERRHHEIYLGDPRKSKPENLKTVIRIPVRNEGERI